MDSTQDESLNGAVSYEGAPIAEVEHEGLEYRIDPGRGSAVAISRREAGTFQWAFVMEGRWDGVQLKAKGLGYPVVSALSSALSQAMRVREESWA
ncbi:MAG TPA: hypothetical protein VHE30_14825 [Polyangiaceae bacterium]|nr:hypothetical protein [Polyangiaceae bacterium]